MYDDYRIVILQGASGSGKSALAKKIVSEQKSPEKWIVVCRDELRQQMMDPEQLQKYFDNGQDWCLEDAITTVEHNNIAKALACGMNVVIDNSNIRKKYVNEYIKIAVDFNIKQTEVALVKLEVDFSEAMERISARGERKIKSDVVASQIESLKGVSWGVSDCYDTLEENRYQKRSWFLPAFKVEPYRRVAGAKKAVICDIDGTLAYRNLILEPSPHLRSWFDYKATDTDGFRPFTRDTILALNAQGVTIIFLSGRKEEGREATEVFLRQTCGFDFPYKLFMRNPKFDRHHNKDDRDDEVKYRLFNEHIRDKYDVLGVIDDRKRVVALWETLGVDVFNAGKLNEVF